MRSKTCESEQNEIVNFRVDFESHLGWRWVIRRGTRACFISSQKYYALLWALAVMYPFVRASHISRCCTRPNHRANWRSTGNWTNLRWNDRQKKSNSSIVCWAMSHWERLFTWYVLAANRKMKWFSMHRSNNRDKCGMRFHAFRQSS